MTPTRRHVDQVAAEAVVTDLAVLVDRWSRNMSETVAALRGMAINDVLDVETVVLDARGQFSRDWVVPFAYVMVANLGGRLTVDTGPQQAQAPGVGPAMFVVGAGHAVGINITGRSLSLYGSAGATVVLHLLAKPLPPFYSVGLGGAASAAETSTLLAGGATATGGTRSTTGFARLRAFASSDQAGTLAIQQSRDGTTWYTTVGPTAVAAGSTTGTVIESILTLAFARAVYVNGGAAQGAFEFDTLLLAA